MTEQPVEEEPTEVELELLMTRQFLLHAISKLPKRELKLTLSQQAEIATQPWTMEAKRDDKGTLYFRAVKTFG